tara:strand:- start:2594 stop:3385 length:792 start_codon:yes stop_codon:yes gene_type:complete
MNINNEKESNDYELELEIEEVFEQIDNEHREGNIWDPEAQIEGAGADYIEEVINEMELPEKSKQNPNKSSLILETISETGSIPVFFQNPSDSFESFDSKLVELNKIIATNSPGVFKGKELSAIHQIVGHGMWTVTPPVELSSGQIVARLDEINNGIETMIPDTRLFPTNDKRFKRSIVFVGSGSKSILDQFSKEIKSFLKPRKYSECLGGDENSDHASYFLLVSITPSEMSRILGIDSNDPSIKKFVDQINNKNEALRSTQTS